MTSARSQFIELIEQDAIPSEYISEALSAANITPDDATWRRFIDHFLLWLGALALAFAVLFFIAYNWNDLGRFAKFAMLECLMVLAIAVYWKLGDVMVGKVCLLVATILLGVLLALYGQTYQTGADPWQLFFNWALLSLPWALIGRFAAIWIVWIGLINLSLILYHQAFRGVFGLMFDSQTEMLWIIFVFNSFVLLVWEYLSGRWRWLLEPWAIRLVAMAGGLPITWLVLHATFDGTATQQIAWLVWALWLGAFYFFYRTQKHDLFMLAMCCLSAIVVLVTFMAKHMLDTGSSANFLLLALIVIGLGAGAAVWLKHIHREWQG